MKKNKSFLILLLIISQFLQAQEYDRTWGTYYGPDISQTNNFNTYTSFTIDSNGNILFNNGIVKNPQHTVSFYNQFITSGNGFDMNLESNNMALTLTQSGTLVSAKYDDKLVLRKDVNQNIFYLQVLQSANPLPSGSTGAWFGSPIGINPLSELYLTKQTANGTILWQTYLPLNGLQYLETDENGNIYLIGNTKLQNGITTGGVFQENFNNYNNSNNLANGYLAKLNPNGQLIWGTYLPFATEKLSYYDGNLYVLGSSDSDTNATTLATTGTFQSQKGSLSITKISAATGNRIWGTYYGNPNNSDLLMCKEIMANQNGIYILGDTFSFDGSTHSYFGTEGSFQANSSDSMDIFLSKFNLDGQRLWSTYFGSPAYETTNQNSNSLALSGNNIYITLVQYSEQSTNLATPGSYMDTPPAPYVFSNPNLDVGYNKFMFAKFNDNGNLNWASYYGGSSKNLISSSFASSISIGVANDNTLYLYGSTRSNTGHTTSGAIQPTNISEELVAYFARFDKKQMMSTTETDHLKDLVLYNNPNNGAFALQGSVLQKKALQMAIYDGAGRLILQQKLNKDYQQSFDFSHQLKTGNYFLELKDNKQLLKSFKLIIK